MIRVTATPNFVYTIRLVPLASHSGRLASALRHNPLSFLTPGLSSLGSLRRSPHLPRRRRQKLTPASPPTTAPSTLDINSSRSSRFPSLPRSRPRSPRPPLTPHAEASRSIRFCLFPRSIEQPLARSSLPHSIPPLHRSLHSTSSSSAPKSPARLPLLCDRNPLHTELSGSPLPLHRIPAPLDRSHRSRLLLPLSDREAFACFASPAGLPVAQPAPHRKLKLSPTCFLCIKIIACFTSLWTARVGLPSCSR